MQIPPPFQNAKSLPLLLVLLWTGSVLASAEAQASTGTATLIPPEITVSLGILADPAGTLTIDNAASGNFGPLENMQALRPSCRVQWVRLTVHADPAARDSQWMLAVDTGWDYVDLYMPGPGGHPHMRSGSLLSPPRRAVPSQELVFPLTLPANGDSIFFLRLEGDDSRRGLAHRFTVSIRRSADVVAATRVFNYKHGVYAGIVLAMVLYNFVLFLGLRERIYLFYTIYVISFGLLWIDRAGFLYQYLWPNSTQWNFDHSFYLVGSAIFFSSLFVRSFLETRSRLMNGLLVGIGALTAIVVAAGLLTTPSTAAPALAWEAILTSLLYGILGLVMLLRGYAPARFFLLAWTILIIANVYYCLIFLGILHGDPSVAEDAVQVSSAIESILLAFALADRVRAIKAENEQQHLRHTADLEEAVEQRTRELVSLNKQLEAASITDPLTGLSNRRMVEIAMARMTTEMMRASLGGDRGSLLICITDLDFFKQINDRYGHETGDAALKLVAEGLSSAIRGSTILSRWGGEEFLLIDRLKDRCTDIAFAERIRLQVADHLRLPVPAGELRMTTSLGLAHYPFAKAYPNLLSWQEVLMIADGSLYRAKEAGKNRWIVARANEEALVEYIAENGEEATSLLCRTRLDQAIDLGLIETLCTPAVRSNGLQM